LYQDVFQADSSVSASSAVDEGDVVASFAAMRDDYFRRNAARDAVSSQLGERLLQGWSMLADLCPICGTPLMSERVGKTEEIACVGCGDAMKFQRDRDGDIVSQRSGTKKNVVITEGSLNNSANDPVVSLGGNAESVIPKSGTVLVEDAPILKFNRRDAKNDASAKLSAKLLQGWAMLDEICVTHDVPLMRDREGVVIIIIIIIIYYLLFIIAIINDNCF
jgi:uncharacterized Zn finger protein (UPF0148 family)